MKFKLSVEINLPKEKVAAYFADPQYLGAYQDGFQRKELQSGIDGQEGAISKMYYLQGRRKLELTETIVKNQLPDVFEGYYHHEHMDNTMKCTFTTIGDDKTRYDSEIDYIAVRGFIPKLMFKFFPSMFKKQAEKWMLQFKSFVESEA